MFFSNSLHYHLRTIQNKINCFQRKSALRGIINYSPRFCCRLRCRQDSSRTRWDIGINLTPKWFTQRPQVRNVENCFYFLFGFYYLNSTFRHKTFFVNWESEWNKVKLSRCASLLATIGQINLEHNMLHHQAFRKKYDRETDYFSTWLLVNSLIVWDFLRHSFWTIFRYRTFGSKSSFWYIN